MLKQINCILFFFLTACATSPEQKMDYPVRDYRTVKLYLDTLNEKAHQQLIATGSYDVEFTELKHGNKQLIFFGTSHVRQVDHPQFRQLVKAFNKLAPQVAFNEGGQVAKEQRYLSRDSSIRLNGEIGLLKFLCDSANIDMENGDLDEQAEMHELKKRVPIDQIYLYMAVERFLNGYKNGFYPNRDFTEAWQNEFIAYVQQAGLGLTREQESFDTLKIIYKRYLGKELRLDSLAEIHDYYLIDNGVLGDVGRTTKIVRDQALLSKIDNALNEYDRVMIVFGGSHRIAVEPALRAIMLKTRR